MKTDFIVTQKHEGEDAHHFEFTNSEGHKVLAHLSHEQYDELDGSDDDKHAKIALEANKAIQAHVDAQED